MKNLQILAALNLPGTKDSKTFCSKLEKICTLITEVKKLPWYSFEVGPAISNTDLQCKVDAFKMSGRYPEQWKYTGGGPGVKEPIESEYGRYNRGAEDIIKTFPAYQTLTIKYGDSDLTIGAAGQYNFDIPANNEFCNYVFNLVGHNVESTEVTPQADRKAYYRAILPAAVIAKIKTALTFCGGDKLRPAMLGVLLDFRSDSELKIVATDAHRLYKSPNTCEASSKKVHSFILPADACKALVAAKRKDSSEPVELVISREVGYYETHEHRYNQRVRGGIEYYTQKHYSKLVFQLKDTSGGNLDISGTLIAAKFPNYECVIPERQPYQVEVDRKTLLQHIAQNLPAANKTTKQVNFHFNVKVTLECFDIDFSYESKTDFNYIKSNVDSLNIKFQGNMLTQILKGMDSKTVILEMSTSTRSAFITDPQTNDLRLLMPLTNSTY